MTTDILGPVDHSNYGQRHVACPERSSLLGWSRGGGAEGAEGGRGVAEVPMTLAFLAFSTRK